MNRRELLWGVSALACGACATMPGLAERLPESQPSRVCDHDLCKYWRAPAEPARPVEGEFIVGLCSLGLPEGV
jgi:hypothetical protein